MQNAMRLPITAAGALMPDAHIGYGLPIGGVLATTDAVIPYAVGVDIACRMRLSIYDMSPHALGQHKERFAKALQEQTKFGTGGKWSGKERPEHEVLDDPAWTSMRLLRSLQYKATEQLGTSGSGNHFAEWGEFELTEDAPDLGLKAGRYLSLLTHSGSRAVGFKIANEYSGIARSLHPKLADVVRHLAWLPLESEAGQEYWIAMELAGRFASANHFVIHQRVAKAAGLEEIAHVENHHNFAWREKIGRWPRSHRPPQGRDTSGTWSTRCHSRLDGRCGYVVRGKGVASSLNSASHGAGRKMGRKQAQKNITKTQRDRYLQQRASRCWVAALMKHRKPTKTSKSDRGAAGFGRNRRQVPAAHRSNGERTRRSLRNWNRRWCEEQECVILSAAKNLLPP
jgi:tRNA-splicing ligase RtcB